MSATKALIDEFEVEAATTRRVLERVPADKLAWKPHDKSMSLGKLALHVAMSPGYITDWAVQDTVTMSGGAPPDPTNTAEILADMIHGTRLHAGDAAEIWLRSQAKKSF